jgi:Fic family protein
MWIQRFEYKSFSPNKITIQWLLSDPELLNLLSEANRQIGRLDAFSELIPDIDFFIKMHITKEATVSSKIEGTQTSFEEALIKKKILTPKREMIGVKSIIILKPLIRLLSLWTNYQYRLVL